MYNSNNDMKELEKLSKVRNNVQPTINFLRTKSDTDFSSKTKNVNHNYNFRPQGLPLGRTIIDSEHRNKPTEKPKIQTFSKSSTNNSEYTKIQRPESTSEKNNNLRPVIPSVEFPAPKFSESRTTNSTSETALSPRSTNSRDSKFILKAQTEKKGAKKSVKYSIVEEVFESENRNEKPIELVDPVFGEITDITSGNNNFQTKIGQRQENNQRMPRKSSTINMIEKKLAELEAVNRVKNGFLKGDQQTNQQFQYRENPKFIHSTFLDDKFDFILI